jgi:RNA polymerase sigma-70 factor (ECF subfamily)
MRHGTATGYRAEQANGERQRVALSRTDFVVLIHDHAPALYRIAYRLVGDCHDAEDIVQETLRSAWKSRKNFDCGRGQRAWLAAILRRRVIDRWRRADHRMVLAGEGPLEVPVSAVDPTTNGFTDEMQLALSQLPSELRESLLLVVVGELTHQETANTLGVPLGTVLSRVSRARQRLRKHLLALSHA